MSAKESFSAGQTREFFGDGDFFRLLQTTGPITVEFYFKGREVAEMVDIEAGYAESFAREQKRFDRIRIYSPTAQDVKWVTRDGSDVRYDRGAASITGVVDLGASTIAALSTQEKTGVYSNSGLLASNTAETIFTPASNVNGVILQTADFAVQQGSSLSPYAVMLSKTGVAPTTIVNGDPVLCAKAGYVSGTIYFEFGSLPREIVIPAGHGLYFLAGGGVSANSPRTARWKNL